MNSKRIKSHLVFAVVLFGVLSTHFISAEDEATTVGGPMATDDQSAPQHSRAPAALETAASGTQETLESATNGDVATGTIATDSGQQVHGAETGTPAVESSPQAAGDGETGTTGAGNGETGTTAAGDGETGTTAGSVPGSAEGTQTEAKTAESSPQGAGGGETTSAGELGTATTEHVQESAGDGETGTSPVESSTEKTEVHAQERDDTTTQSVQGYTTRRAETEETTASVQETSTAEYAKPLGQTGTEGHAETTAAGSKTEKAFTSTQAPSVGYNKSCETWAAIVYTPTTKWNFYLTITEIDEEKANKYKYTILFVMRNAANSNVSKTLSRTTERDSPINCSDAALTNQFKQLLKRLMNTSDKRIRRQADEIETKMENGTASFTVPKEVILENFEKVFLDFLSDSSEESATQDTSTLPASSTTTTYNYGSSPQPVQASPTPGKQGIWEAHFGLFLTVIILVAVCVVVTSVCCLCMVWRGRGRDQHPDKQPMAMEEARAAPTAVSNPIPDAEMIQDEAPMQERENPAVTPNGGGQHISKAEEDNGWVVPLDELSKAEKEKPEVENTRL